MPHVTSAVAGGVALDWRRGQIGRLAPCVHCQRPALCRSPATGMPCHKTCAENWIASTAQDPADLARLITAHTPVRGGRR